MPRPKLNRCINFDPKVTYFKPQGVPMRYLDTVELSMEEIEALRLKNVEQLDQGECASKMNTSQSTFHVYYINTYPILSIVSTYLDNVYIYLSVFLIFSSTNLISDSN